MYVMAQETPVDEKRKHGPQTSCPMGTGLELVIL